ncbi:MAG: 5-formyltetrahydrofolate cyclo-ligase [Thermodesulfobacterium geofontis]|uniref:5-formyltetrahydrofolate cyclo-ligase n=1 Tax=Thermodesulfobacterium geofontis TaxID=1295609 RepID=A0A2N7PNF2_9BACT|nr:MAG: 5-formyltetrahydrofolate cyclo-ligase [Thermodesulfobacterium geofontis]
MEISSKSQIRIFIFELRKKYSSEILKKFSLQICKFIEGLPLYKKAKSIVFYFAKEKEVSLEYLIGKAFLEGKKVFLPKTWLEEKTLTFHQIFSFADLKPGPFELLEPPSKNPELKPENFEILFVPGVAFDLEKGRIGYGGGFYDKILCKTKAFKIGVAFSFQIFEKLPLEKYDQKVDIIVTEKGIINELKN